MGFAAICSGEVLESNPNVKIGSMPELSRLEAQILFPQVDQASFSILSQKVSFVIGVGCVTQAIHNVSGNGTGVVSQALSSFQAKWVHFLNILQQLAGFCFVPLARTNSSIIADG